MLQWHISISWNFFHRTHSFSPCSCVLIVKIVDNLICLFDLYLTWWHHLSKLLWVGECRRTGDCARRVQRDVDAFYAPSRSRGKCAFSSRTLNFADFFKFLGPNDVTEVKPLVRKMVHSRIWIAQNTQLNLKISTLSWRVYLKNVTG